MPASIRASRVRPHSTSRGAHPCARRAGPRGPRRAPPASRRAGTRARRAPPARGRASRGRGGLRVRGRRSSRFRVSERSAGQPRPPWLRARVTLGVRPLHPGGEGARSVRFSTEDAPDAGETVTLGVRALRGRRGAPAGGRARRLAGRGDGARATRLQRAGGGPQLPRGGGAARPSGPAGRAGGHCADPRACPARHADRGIRRLRRRRSLLDGDARPHPARARRRPGLDAAEPLRRGLWALGRRGRAARGARDGIARDRRLRGHRGRAGGGGPRSRARRRRHGPPPARTGASRLPARASRPARRRGLSRSALRRRGRPEALAGAPGRRPATTRAAPKRISTSRRSPRSATSSRSATRTGASSGRGCARSRAARSRGCAR